MATEKDEKRDQILTQARDVLERFGLRKTTMEDIAQGCGLRKASLYYYFDSKEAIVAELMRRIGQDLCQRTRERVARASNVIEAFHSFFHGPEVTGSQDVLFLLGLAREDLFTMLPLAEKAMEELERDHLTALIEVIQRGVAEGTFHVDDPQRTAEALFHVSKAVHRTIVLDGLSNVERKFDDVAIFVELAARGITTPPKDGEGGPATT